MPVLDKITVNNFRNIAFAELEFSPRINCICGDNGQGKTNLLDAIHYVSLARSFGGTPDSFCYRHGTDSFSIGALFTMPDGLSSRFVVTGVKGGRKILKRDDRIYEKISLHMGVLPVVVVSPQDTSLVSEGGEERRRFADTVLSQTDREYLTALQQYRRTLMQRNQLLKGSNPDSDLLDALDASLCEASVAVVRGRRALAGGLSSAAGDYYSRLSGGGEQISVAYRPDVEPGDDAAAAMALALRGARHRDLLVKYTTVGLQRDDFEFLMDGYPLRRCGSQGQQKSFLVALKLAQYDMMDRMCGRHPLLLLDDVFDKLDSARVKNMLGMAGGGSFGQIFITDTNRGRLEALVGDFSKDARYFNACNGEF